MHAELGNTEMERLRRPKRHPNGIPSTTNFQYPDLRNTASLSLFDENFTPNLEQYLRKTFLWKVDGYREMMSPDKDHEVVKSFYRRSPSFRFLGRTWYLHLYPNLPNMVVCLLLSGECPGPPIRLYLSFGLEDANRDVEWKIRGVGSFGAGTTTVWRKGKCFISKEELAKREAELVYDDAITIVCSLSTEQCKRFLRDFICPYELFENLERDRNEEDYDVVFIVRGVRRLANSNALRLKSPVFASTVVPGSTHRLDCNPVAFSMLLLYVERGKLCRLSVQRTLQLYELAIDYRVVGLRERCLACVTAWLEPEVVLSVLDYAKEESETKLMAVATKYLVSHAQQVVATREWLQMVKDDPKRANYFYKKIAERFSPGVCS